MINPTNAGTAPVHLDRGTSLAAIVSKALKSRPIDNSSCHNEIFNDIPGSIRTEADSTTISALIYDLISTVLSNAKNGKIRLTAEKVGGYTNLQIVDRNNYNGFALASRLLLIQPIARRLGGELSIKGERALITTIQLNIPDRNYPEMA